MNDVGRGGGDPNGNGCIKQELRLEFRMGLKVCLMRTCEFDPKYETLALEVEVVRLILLVGITI